MTGFIAFTKKEFCESLRTYKFFVICIVFLILGIMNPLTAKLTPDLIASFLPEGMMMNLSEPTAMDSWMQFFKNVPQIGLIATVILFSGMLTGEISRGTLINVLTKGLSRSSVILSKFFTSVLIFTVAYLLCFGVSYGYTAYFWNSGTPHLLFSIFCLWVFGIVLIASLSLGGVLLKSGYGALLFTGGITICFFLLNFLPKLQKYVPIKLASDNLSLLKGDAALSDFTWSIVISGILILLFVSASVAIFNKKQL